MAEEASIPTTQQGPATQVAAAGVGLAPFWGSNAMAEIQLGSGENNAREDQILPRAISNKHPTHSSVIDVRARAASQSRLGQLRPMNRRLIPKRILDQRAMKPRPTSFDN
ncbi:hypothetical protein FQR65_LT01354 [Abscondita terminalis]|nr:hypothetical protein FQR65_LT01354 [Abscondita terminalis]